MNYLWGYLIGYGFVFAIIFGAGALYKIFKFDPEISRKIIHISMCFAWVVIYYFFRDSWQALVMPLSFVIINALSLKFHIFKGMEREGEKSSPGTVYYAMAFTIIVACSLIWEELWIPGGLGIFCLSFGDGFAALYGTKFGEGTPKITKTKSLMGSYACFCYSMVGMAILAFIVPVELELPYLLLLSLAATVFELAGFGLDNFSISIGVMLLGALFQRL